VSARLKRIRKLLYAAAGAAVALALLIPPESPGRLNEIAAAVLAVGALFGVYKARNAPPASAEGLLSQRARIHDERGGYPPTD
jgi:hypothetical protein